jgi:hypothetical protein
MQLTPANITIGIDSEYWLYTNRQKTSNPVRVPLLPKALEIIDKYKDIQELYQTERCFQTYPIKS